MHRVAVIDTVIDSRKLHCQRFESYNVCRRGGEALTGTGISHGTMVALVLDHCLENYELVSIQVLPDDSGRKGRQPEILEIWRPRLGYARSWKLM